MTHWQFTLYVLLSLVAMIVSAGVALLTWRRRPAPGAAQLALLMLAVTVWLLGHALCLMSVSLRAKLFWEAIRFTGVIATPVACLAFVLQLSAIYRPAAATRRVLMWLALSLAPFATLLLIWTNETHYLVYSEVRLDTGGPFPLLDVTYGPWFYVHVSYSYLLLLIGISHLYRTRRRIAHSRLYRSQTTLLLISTLAPLAASALDIAGLKPFRYLSLTPLAFTLTGLVMFWNLYRLRLLDLMPVARDLVIENMEDVLIVLDDRNRIVDLNSAAARLLDYPAAKAIGQPVAFAFSHWPDLAEHCRAASEAEVTFDVAAAQRHFDARLSPLRDRLDNPAGRLLVLSDVTARVRAERALQKARDELEERVEERAAELLRANAQLRQEIAERELAEEKVQHLLDQQVAVNRLALALGRTNDLDEIYYIIYDHVRLLMDIAAFIVSSYDLKEQLIHAGFVITGGTVLNVVDLPPIPLEEPGCGTQSRVIHAGKPLYIPDWRRAMEKTQTQYHIDDTGNDIFSGPPPPEARPDSTNSALLAPMQVRGETVGVMQAQSHRLDAYSQEDIDLLAAMANVASVAIENARLYAGEQQRAAELARTLEQRRELDRLRSELIQNVSHELRTPLAIARGNAELLADGDLGKLTSRQRTSAATVVRRLRMLGNMIENFVTLDAGIQEREPVNLSDLLRELLADFQIVAEQAGLDLTAQIAPALPPVWGDPARLRQVVSNLLDNAIKFTPAGGRVAVRLRREGKDVSLKVTDTGIGIPPDQMKRVFERFYQVDGSATRRYGGTGMGLALVKEVVEACGGRVYVESKVGVGSVFAILLPVQGATNDDNPQA